MRAGISDSEFSYLPRHARRLIEETYDDLLLARGAFTYQSLVATLKNTSVLELGEGDDTWPRALENGDVLDAWSLGLLSLRRLSRFPGLSPDDATHAANSLQAFTDNALGTVRTTPNISVRSAFDSALLVNAMRYVHVRKLVDEDTSWGDARLLKKWLLDPSDAWDSYARNSADVVALLESLPEQELPESISEELTLLRFAVRENWVDPGKTTASKSKPPPALRIKKSTTQIHGGLPKEIADAVENVELQTKFLSATLRQYQIFGARYIVHRERVILGDDMGLGKTVQALAAMCHYAASGKTRFLVVAPNNVLINWQREVAKHTLLESVMLHGEQRDDAVHLWRAEGGVGLTTFGTVGRLDIRPSDIDMLVVDEAHFVKNPDAARSQVIRRLAEGTPYVALLTGTALENRLRELYHLVEVANFSLRNVAAQLADHEWSLDPDDAKLILAPVYLRRRQADVLHELPKITEIEECVLLEKADLAAYEEATDLMTERFLATRGAGPESSPKYERLAELVDAYRDEGRKMVIFSFFRTVLTDVQDIIGYCPIINGSVKAAERQEIIDTFTNQRGFAALALQVDAGGIGINLQAAEVVVLMEPQLKPSTEAQAIARVQRMGQAKPVTVHRLVALNTVEAKIQIWLKQKREIFTAYADPSSVKDASYMAIDSSSESFEDEVNRLLNAGDEG